MMKFRSVVASAAIGAAVILGGQSAAHAASPSLQPLASIIKQVAAESSSTAQDVRYKNRRGWRSRCANRHGLHTRAYRRCLNRHASHPRAHHRKWRVRCANRWGWNTPRFRTCLRNHGAY
ncbi:MAG: hypothetical protein ACFCUR_18695 [Rhodomicrobiaceae bacterium]